MNGTSMSDEVIDRKIAVIFVADVVGYSKHMEKGVKLCPNTQEAATADRSS